MIYDPCSSFVYTNELFIYSSPIKVHSIALGIRYFEKLWKGMKVVVRFFSSE